MNTIRELPLEKMVDRPEIERGINDSFETVIPQEIVNFIFFSFLESEGLATLDLVSKKWHHFTNNDHLWNTVIARQMQQNGFIVFGKDKWNQYFGEISNVPNYPRHICKVLLTNSPFSGNTLMGKTHMFVLMPETVNGEPFTLNYLDKLYQDLKLKENKTYPLRMLNAFDQYGNISIGKAYWMMISYHWIPQTEWKNYEDQKAILHKYSYSVPNLLCAAISCIIKDLCFNYISFRNGFTRCQEDVQGNQVIVDIRSSPLIVLHTDNNPHLQIGVLGCRIFEKKDVAGDKNKF